MTAEIAVMNKEAIALAADSAVTMRDETGEKVFPSANKIFALSKHQPIAAMIYGNASFLGVPWEPIIKVFRRELGRTSYRTVREYATELLRFVRAQRGLFPKDRCDAFCRFHVEDTLGMVRDHIDFEHQHATPAIPGCPPDPALVAQNVEYFKAVWEQSDPADGVPRGEQARVENKYRKIIGDAIDRVFTGIKLTNKLRRALFRIGVSCFLKYPFDQFCPTATGLVVAGFGTAEFFPSLHATSLQGIFDGRLHHRKDNPVKVGFDMEAVIVPFAQDDVVFAFMEGVDREYQRVIQDDIRSLVTAYPEIVIESCGFLDDTAKAKIKARFARRSPAVIQKYLQRLQNYRRGVFTNPVARMVSMLPKSELPMLAESMVNLTSLRRRIEMGIETVGGPVDVAMISKGDGLIWIKRKHYFDPNLNLQFFENYNPKEKR